MHITTIDLETYLISRGEGAAPRPVVVSVHTDSDHYLARPADVDWSFLDTDLILGANIAFDMSVLIRHVPALRGRILRAYAEQRVVDAALAHVLVCVSQGIPSGETGLAALVRRYCGQTIDKDAWRLHYSQLEPIPLEYWPEGAVRYALDDTYWPRRVLAEIRARDEHGALGVLGHLTDAAWALHETSINGVHTHPDRSRLLVAKSAARADRVRAALQAAGLVRANGTKDTKLVRRMAEYVGITAKTEGGAVSVGKAAVAQAAAKTPAELLEPDAPLAYLASDHVDPRVAGLVLLPMYAEYTQADKMQTAATMLLEGHTEVLQTRFTSCLKTYRTASSMPDPAGPLRGVQMQNPWREGGYREVFVPDEGELHIGSDYVMAELFSLAAICKLRFGFSRLGDVLMSGQDVHIITAADIHGTTPAEVLASPNRKKLRNEAKALIFGIPGGLGGATMVTYGRQYGVELSEGEWKAKIARIKTVYPEIGLYLRWVSDRGYPWVNKHPITGFVRGGCGYTNGANTGFQSLTAYYAKTALARACRARWDEASPLYGFKSWNIVHDEILARGPAARAPAAAAELGRIMCEAADEVLYGYRIRTDPWVADVWSKAIPDNLPVDDDGLVIPWYYTE
jgi:hypothetical protein